MSIYFPVLRWKQGEQAALANLAPEVKERIVPIIEFPLGCGCEDRKFDDFCSNAIRYWGTDRPFYLDLSAVDYGGAPDGADHPALTLLRTAHQQRLLLIPIFYIDMDPDIFSIIQQAHSSGYFDNVALRINEDEEDAASSDATEMINSLGVREANVDLIIDLRDISRGHVRAKIRMLRDLVEQFGNGYRRKIVISGAIPNKLNIETDHSEQIHRYDWQLWRRAQSIQELSGLLYGDYTTVPAEFEEVPYRGAPKIKYTLEDRWFVIKGHRPRGRDNQRQEQAREIAGSSYFLGAGFSFGDSRIRQCADGEWGPGSPANWVTNDISHHITFVASQVSSIQHEP